MIYLPICIALPLDVFCLWRWPIAQRQQLKRSDERLATTIWPFLESEWARHRRRFRDRGAD